MRRRVRIVGTGQALPGEAITNAQVLKVAGLGEDITEDWIESRIGIKTRYSSVKFPVDIDQVVPSEKNSNSDLCVRAILAALKMSSLSPSNLDLIIIATCTPDYLLPSTSSIVLDKLRINNCAAIDIRSACSGWTQGVVTALQFLQTGYYKTIAVVGSETGSLFGKFNTHQRKHAGKGDSVNIVMMGDGAGCVVLQGLEENEDDRGIEVIYTKINCIGKDKGFGMYLPAGGSERPFGKKVLEEESHFFAHDFRGVLKHGPELYWRGMQDCFKAMGLGFEDIDVFVPHQANGKVKEIAKTMGVPQERMYGNFEKIGNTANASLPLCLDDLVQQDDLPDDALILLLAAESTKWLYGTLLLKWKALKKQNGGESRQKRERVKARWTQRVMFWMVSLLVTLWFCVKRIIGR